MISKAVDRIKKQIQKQKDKEKKMWGNVFGASSSAAAAPSSS